VPLVISNPVLFPKRQETDALGSLVDVLPTLLEVAGASEEHGASDLGLRGRSLAPIMAAKAGPERERVERLPVDLGPVLDHEAPAETVQDAVHFTYDDHQAGTALTEAPGQPNRVRAIRTATHKYAIYFDPKGERSSEYEMYDLQRDPDEVHNLLHVNRGTTHDAADRGEHMELKERLDTAMKDARTAP
jgi:arylsulfatase A-like enzyme